MKIKNPKYLRIATRYKIYNQALHNLSITGSGSGSFICMQLYWALENFNYDPSDNLCPFKYLKDIFPEVARQKPAEPYNNMFWFKLDDEGWEQRKQVLRNAIKEIRYIIYYNKAKKR